MSRLFDTVVHKFLNFPYSLHVTFHRKVKKSRETIVFLHGIGNTANSWADVISMIPKDVNVIAVDLLGFGDSPKPIDIQYSVRRQVRSLGVTLLKQGLRQRVTIVGHSLGALVAIGAAKRYKGLVKRIVLCSPPLYKKENMQGMSSVDGMLRDIYRVAKKHPDQLKALLPLAVRLGFANKSLRVDDANIHAYISALESSIINQTSLSDLMNLAIPVRIVYGTLDPVVVAKHIKYAAKNNANITTKSYIGGHEIVGRYVKLVADELR